VLNTLPEQLYRKFFAITTFCIIKGGGLGHRPFPAAAQLLSRLESGQVLFLVLKCAALGVYLLFTTLLTVFIVVYWTIKVPVFNKMIPNEYFYTIKMNNYFENKNRHDLTIKHQFFFSGGSLYGNRFVELLDITILK